MKQGEIKKKKFPDFIAFEHNRSEDFLNKKLPLKRPLSGYWFTPHPPLPANFTVSDSLSKFLILCSPLKGYYLHNSGTVKNWDLFDTNKLHELIDLEKKALFKLFP